MSHRACGSECGLCVTLDLVQSSFEGHPTTSLYPDLLFDPQREKDFPCVAVGKYIWNFPCPRLCLWIPILSPSFQEITVDSSTFSMSVLFWQLSNPTSAGRELGRAMKVTTSKERGRGPSGPGPLTSSQPCASPPPPTPSSCSVQHQQGGPSLHTQGS